ncbi:hypothetical protein E7744_02955 [Citricoccus sp. SGAir0253]|uniref:hypothetical protein n=1 Tax=Citricoccus sp. SGAir0253 TaxID=2567881 RepID=UPI0010CD03C9|nr:hypothetical protein [Citricoccus sp. SGAir0253]QCU77288.1 hypothetical protein E7744_02955 [Citricoccus sp. SGAir0253]
MASPRTGAHAVTPAAVRRMLGVPGRWSGAVAALATAASVLGLLATLWDGPVAAALFALVLLGDVVVRLAPLRPPVQAVTVLCLPAAAWAALADAYQRVSGLDLLAHWAVTGLLAVLAAALVGRGGWLRATPAGTVLLTVALGTTLAVVWEFGEWVGHTLLDPGIQVGYDDTVGDLAAGALGALVAGLLHDRLVTGTPHGGSRGGASPAHGVSAEGASAGGRRTGAATDGGTPATRTPAGSPGTLPSRPPVGPAA